MKALPSNQAMWEELGGKGLHMFLVEMQDGTEESLGKYAKERGLTFPIPVVNGCSFSNYDGGGNVSLPYAYVIGPDGKVAWQGKSGYEAQVRAQLARIKYRKLRRMEIDPAVTPAAQAFEDGNYAEAHDAALKAKEAAGEDAEALADADFVLKKFDEHMATLRAKIDEAKSARRYHEAVAMLEDLSGKAYKGLPECDAAKEELKALKKDKDVKSELKAWDALAKTLEANEKAKDDEDRRKNLEKFIKKYEGTAAAEEAAGMQSGGK